MRYLINICFLILIGCSEPKDVEVQKFVIKDIWTEKSSLNPSDIRTKFIALLSNGDTISCTVNTKVGDTIYYNYIKNESLR